MLFDGHRITTAQRQVESWVSDLKYLDASSDVPAQSIAMGRVILYGPRGRDGAMLGGQRCRTVG